MYLRNCLLVPHPAARILRKGNGVFDFVRGSGYVGFHSCLAKELGQLVMEFRNALAGNCEAFGKEDRAKREGFYKDPTEAPEPRPRTVYILNTMFQKWARTV